MAKKTVVRSGPPSLFHGKVRKPVTLTLNPAHHAKVKGSMQRLGLTRADVVALLIEKYADTVTVDFPSAYKKLRDAVAGLGGTLTHEKRGEPRGGTWVLRLGDKCLRMPSEQSERYPLLDACYRLKEGVPLSGTWRDREDEIEPKGLAELFSRLASEEIDVGASDIRSVSKDE
jgi:hypothetical protein